MQEQQAGLFHTLPHSPFPPFRQKCKHNRFGRRKLPFKQTAGRRRDTDMAMARSVCVNLPSAGGAAEGKKKYKNLSLFPFLCINVCCCLVFVSFAFLEFITALSVCQLVCFLLYVFSSFFPALFCIFLQQPSWSNRLINSRAFHAALNQFAYCAEKQRGKKKSERAKKKSTYKVFKFNFPSAKEIMEISGL